MTTATDPPGFIAAREMVKALHFSPYAEYNDGTVVRLAAYRRREDAALILSDIDAHTLIAGMTSRGWKWIRDLQTTHAITLTFEADAAALRE